VIALLIPLYDGQMWLPSSVLSIPLFIIGIQSIGTNERMSIKKLSFLILLTIMCVLFDFVTIIPLLVFFALCYIQTNTPKLRKVIIMTTSIFIFGIGLWAVSQYSLVDIPSIFTKNVNTLYLTLGILAVTLVYIVINLIQKDRIGVMKYILIISSLMITEQLPALALIASYVAVKMVSELRIRLKTKQFIIPLGSYIVLILVVATSIYKYSSQKNTAMLMQNELTKVITTVTQSEDLIWAPSQPLLYISTNRLSGLTYGQTTDINNTTLTYAQLPKVIVYDKQELNNKSAEDLIQSKYDQNR